MTKSSRKSFCSHWPRREVVKKGSGEEIRELVAQGKPVLIYRKFRVLPNAWFGITGGWEVEFLLLYLEKAEHFEQQLPDDTRAELAKGNKGAFLGYPFYQTLEENAPDITGLTTPQVSLLAAQAEYSLKENAALLKQFLGAFYSPRAAARSLLAVAQVLRRIHRDGFVYNDLHDGNILRRLDMDSYKVIDLGSVTRALAALNVAM
ncbi:unnamed protein product [Cladocopium goreaui]|uniref:PNPLA domain-containing protein n=1 Tax=Cladocopium goreaui TaxID=2562237 RepID=A0A9P1CDZ4_9DINO|nr:unnamed protein product [Cladocopium goreaui]